MSLIIHKGEKRLAIYHFNGEWRALSNFYPCFVEMPDKKVYPSVEHAYQAYKTLDEELRFYIRESNTAGAAKKKGRQLDLRGDWEQVKVGVMAHALKRKFLDNELPRGVLLRTKGLYLLEGNRWGDTFWGAMFNEQTLDTYEGENKLGELLMLIRDNLLK